MAKLLRAHAARLLTAALAAGLFVAAQPAALSTAGRAALAGGLRFDTAELVPADLGVPFRGVRAVNPALRTIDGWISSVGAAVALADIDGDGLPNDICLVDPRNDSVTVMPAPGTGARYAPFALAAPHHGYDPATVAPMGCLAGDLNGDGATDLVVHYWGRTPLVFLGAAGRMDAAGFAPAELVGRRERWYTNAALLSDLDGDGHADLVFGNYFPDDGEILNVAAKSGGAMQHSMSRAYNGGRNRLLRWAGVRDGRPVFADASDAFTKAMATGWTLALAAADVDGDLRPELYVANDFGPDRLLHNRSTPDNIRFALAEGRRSLLATRSGVMGRDSFKGMGADFGDVNGDGLPDLAVSNIAEDYALLEHHFLFVHNGRGDRLARGEAPYRDESGPRGTARSAWAWDIKFADLDNDGRPELLQAVGFLRGSRNAWPELQELATANDEMVARPAIWARFGGDADLSGWEHDRVFAAGADGRYWDVAPAIGLGRPTVSRGIATADVDGDGRIDFAVARQWLPSLFHRNRSTPRGGFLALDLRLANGNGTSRPAIGARASTILADGRILSAEVDGGSGHGGKRAPIVHFGLGASPAGPIAVRVAWRSGGAAHARLYRLAPGAHRIVLVSSGAAS